MSIAALMALAEVAIDTASKFQALIARCQAENRDPTPEEIAALKSSRDAADADWDKLHKP
jgi:hypothetical protein